MKGNTPERAKALIAKHTPKTKPWILTRPETELERAQRLGYNTVEEMRKRDELRKKLEYEMPTRQLHVRDEAKKRRAVALANAKDELETRLRHKIEYDSFGPQGHMLLHKGEIDAYTGIIIEREGRANLRHIVRVKSLIRYLEELIKHD